MTSSKIPLFFLIAALFWPANYAWADPSIDDTLKKFDQDGKNTPIQVRGDSVEYFHEEQKAVGVGHVSIDYEDVALKADKITVFMATKIAVAEGHVTLVQKGRSEERRVGKECRS